MPDGQGKAVGYRAPVGGAGVTAPAVQAVLEGRGSYDQINVQEQAIVRAHWAECIEETRKNLRLDRILAAQGREVVELHGQGEVTVRKTCAVRIP